MSWSSPIKHRGDGAALRAAVLLALAAVTAAVILVAVVFVAVVLVPGWSAAWALADKPRVIAVHTGPQSQVSMVVEAQSNPSGRDLSSDDVSVTIGGRRVPTTVTPVASSSLSVAIVIDAASGTTPQMLEAVQSGATEFLLRLPAGAHTMVVTAGDDPRVAAPLNPAPADALTAIATIQPDGARATAAGALLAAQELASAPAGRARSSSSPAVATNTRRRSNGLVGRSRRSAPSRTSSRPVTTTTGSGWSTAPAARCCPSARKGSSPPTNVWRPRSTTTTSLPSSRPWDYQQ